jgi:hypothetical protein
MNMQCDQFEKILEQQEDDGRLPKPALDHIDTCEACRALSADLDAIHGMAVEMGSEEIAPPDRVWIALRNQLEAEGVIRDVEHEAQPTFSPVGHAWWMAFQRPAFAGAFLSLILFAAAMITYQGGDLQMAAHPQFAPLEESSPTFSADSVFKEEIVTVGNDDGTEAIPGLENRDRAVTDSIRRNLGVVDKFIAMCEKSVREQPDNEMAREYLYGAYQQKAELLATATNRSVMGGLQ